MHTRWTLRIAIGAALTGPFVALAAPATLTELIRLLISLVSQLTVLVAAIALLVFFWGLAKFILNAGSEDKRKEGKQVMLWGVIALFVMVSIWGIVQFFQYSFFGGTPPSNLTPPSFDELYDNYDWFDGSPDDPTIGT